MISRRDTLRNTGKKNLSVRRYLARFPFNRGEYELYSQQGRWRRESVGARHKLLDSKAELSSREGRWCEGSAPYAVLRDNYSTHALAFMVCPEGDWVLNENLADSQKYSKMHPKAMLLTNSKAIYKSVAGPSGYVRVVGPSTIYSYQLNKLSKIQDMLAGPFNHNRSGNFFFASGSVMTRKYMTCNIICMTEWTIILDEANPTAAR